MYQDCYNTLALDLSVYFAIMGYSFKAMLSIFVGGAGPDSRTGHLGPGPEILGPEIKGIHTKNVFKKLKN